MLFLSILLLSRSGSTLRTLGTTTVRSFPNCNASCGLTFHLDQAPIYSDEEVLTIRAVL